MKNQPKEDFDQQSPESRKEEFPIEEFDGVADWNATAWEKIQAVRADATRTQKLTDYLSWQETTRLNAMLNVCRHENQDRELQELIIIELERRSATL